MRFCLSSLLLCLCHVILAESMPALSPENFDLVTVDTAFEFCFNKLLKTPRVTKPSRQETKDCLVTALAQMSDPLREYLGNGGSLSSFSVPPGPVDSPQQLDKTKHALNSRIYFDKPYPIEQDALLWSSFSKPQWRSNQVPRIPLSSSRLIQNDQFYQQHPRHYINRPVNGQANRRYNTNSMRRPVTTFNKLKQTLPEHSIITPYHKSD